MPVKDLTYLLIFDKDQVERQKYDVTLYAEFEIKLEFNSE